MSKQTSTVWDGDPPSEGWHWLTRKSDGETRMAHWSYRSSWHISDSIGRTTFYDEARAARLYSYRGAITTAAVQDQLVEALNDCADWIGTALEGEESTNSHWEVERRARAAIAAAASPARQQDTSDG